MKDFLIVLFFILGSVYGAFQGALILVSPLKHRRFVAWLRTKLGGKNALGVQETPLLGLQLQARLAGAFLLALCLWFIWEGLFKIIRLL